MKVNNHYRFEIADSWKKVTIPLEGFIKITNLDSITEVNLSIDYDVDNTDGVIYINGICFSN